MRVSVVLGPDSSATAETERAWLHRMAIRYGGRHELEGGMEVLSLPADGVTEAKERDLLRKELDEARKQGEAYARELAQVFAQGGEDATTPSTFPPPLSGTAPAERMAVLTRFAGGIAAELRGLLSQVGRDVQTVRMHQHTSTRQGAQPPGQPPLDEADERLESIKRRMRQVQEIVAELALVGELDPNEGIAEVDLVDLVRSAVRNVTPFVERGGIELTLVTVPEGEGIRVPVRLGARAGALLVRELLAQAVAATPREQQVVVTVTAAGAGDKPELGPRLTVDDAGAALPSTVRRAFLNLELEPSTYGRPSSIPLYVCSEVAAWQGVLLELADAPAGGLRVGLNFPRIGRGV